MRPPLVPLDKSIFLSVPLTQNLCGVSFRDGGLSEAMYWFQLDIKTTGLGMQLGNKKSYAVQNFAFKCKCCQRLNRYVVSSA